MFESDNEQPRREGAARLSYFPLSIFQKASYASFDSRARQCQTYCHDQQTLYLATARRRRQGNLEPAARGQTGDTRELCYSLAMKDRDARVRRVERNRRR